MNKTRKIKRICVKIEKIDVLAKRFECSRATIYNALSYKTNSKKADEIRHDAINRYQGIKNEFKMPL